MEIKTRYNIGDTVYFIKNRGVVNGGSSFAITSDSIGSGTITSISIEENNVLYCISNRCFKEDDITTDSGLAEARLMDKLEKDLNDFIAKDNDNEIKSSNQLADLYAILKSARDLGCCFEITSKEEFENRFSWGCK